MSTFLRKSFAITLGVTSLVMLSGFVSVSPAKAASAGDLVKVAGSSAVYYVGADNKRYVFPNDKTFFSWYADFSTVKTISQSEYLSLNPGGNVPVRAGTYLLKIVNDPKVYVTTPGMVLRHIASEAQALAMFGTSWAQRVIDYNEAFMVPPAVSYGEAVTSGFTTGMLVKVGSTLYYVDGTSKRLVSDAGKSGNMFRDQFAVTASDLSGYSDGAAISGMESTLSTLAGSGAVVVTPTGSGLTVALAADTAAASSIIVDTGANNAQSLIEVMKLNFSASSDGAVKVKTIKLKRLGISSDSTVSSAYLYDGSTRLAEYSTLSSGVITFMDSAKLFEVAAGSSKVITVKFDLANSASSGNTIGFGLNAAADVVTDGATVNGTFPVNGNLMSIASVPDLGILNIASFTTFPATVDPGSTGFEVWRFNLAATDQNIQVSKLNLTLVGTVAQSDLQNIKLSVSGVQLGSTVAQVNSSNEALFDLSASPYTITSGQTKTVLVTADIVGGTGRAFKFTIRKSSDVTVKDGNYNVWVTPTVSSAAFTIVEPTTGSGTSINNGKLTVERASDSPATNVALGATGVTLAKFNFKATGEAIKISTVVVETVTSSTGGTSTDAENLNNGKLYVDGTQLGSTADLDSDDTDDTNFTDSATDALGGGTDDDISFSLGNSFIIPAGTTKVLSVVADILDGNGGVLGGTTTTGPTVRVSVGGISATGQTSLATITVGTADGSTLSAVSGALTAAENLSLVDATSVTPTGVKGATNTKIASFVITAGSGEGVTVTQIVMDDNTTSACAAANTNIRPLGCNFQNVMLKHGSTQIGSTVTSMSSTAQNTLTFTPSPSISLAASEQYVVDVYGDILSSAQDTSQAFDVIRFKSVAGTGVVTSSTADFDNSSTPITIQRVYIAANGDLTITVNSSTPASTLMAADGLTETEIARFDFDQTNGAENVIVTQIVLTGDANATAWTNIKISAADGAISGAQTVNTFSAASSGTATFSNLNWIITKGMTKTLIVKATPSAFPNGTAGQATTFSLAATTAVTARGADSSVSAGSIPSTAQSSNAMGWYRTALTMTGGLASSHCTSSCTRTSSDKFLSLGFTSHAASNATLRGALQANDESTTGWTATGQAVTAAANNVIEGTNTIRVTEDGASAVADHTHYDFGTSVDLGDYTKASFWIYTSAAKAAAGDLTVVLSETADTTNDGTLNGLGTSPVTLTVPAISATTKTYVELDISGASSSVTYRYMTINVAANVDNGATWDIDNVRFYNDSINIDLASGGSLLSGALGSVVTLKDSSSNTKLIGYINRSSASAATVVLTVGADIAAGGLSADIGFGSSTTTYDAYLNSITVLDDQANISDSLSMNIDLGASGSAGDVRWYDNAVTSPATWVKGSTPLQASASY